jgi:Ca2+-binding RTX toxin-like protein
MRHRKRKAVLGVTLALLAVALLPANAYASTASVEIKRVFYLAGSGEANNLTISLSPTDYTLSDTGATIAAGPGCSAGGSTATCPAGGIIGITVSASDGGDTINNTTPTPSTLSGGDGDDALQGGSGNDLLRGNKGVDNHNGGPGDDYIDTRGNAGDVVTCGAGTDTVIADVEDSVGPDCEIVDRGGAVAPPPPTTPPSSPPPAPPLSAAVLLGAAEFRTLARGACAQNKLGTPGNDRLDGTALGDNLFGLQGNDILNGLRDDDCLFGGAGSDRLSGSQGDDRLLGDDSTRRAAGRDRLSGGAGADLLIGRRGKDRLSGGAGNDRLRGGRGNDRLIAGGGRNRLSGGSGNDRLNALNGKRDRLSCGRGRDRARAERIDRVRGCERIRRPGRRKKRAEED